MWNIIAIDTSQMPEILIRIFIIFINFHCGLSHGPDLKGPKNLRACTIPINNGMPNTEYKQTEKGFNALAPIPSFVVKQILYMNRVFKS